MPPEEEPRRRSLREWTWTLVPRSRAHGRPSFWSTSAGVATAVASLLTAITGLLVALVQLGVIGDEGSSAALPVVPTMTVSTVAPENMSEEDEQRLLRHVPEDIRHACGTTAYHDDRALAAVDCSEGGVSDLHYELFDSKADLDEHWAERMDSTNVPVDSGDCAGGSPGSADYTRESGGGAGQLVCYEGEGKGWIEWTSAPVLVYAYAARADRDLAALYRWWLDVPGPV
jgi:hypothetical protein